MGASQGCDAIFPTPTRAGRGFVTGLRRNAEVRCVRHPVSLGLGLIVLLVAGAAFPGAADGGATPTGNAAEELALSEIFRKPIGPRGLEYSERARRLAGRRVRLTGYQVRQTAPIPFAILLSPVPVSLHEREYGLAEDLPASSVHVFFQRNPQPLVPWTPGPRTVEGTLVIGAREEADGRISHVRLESALPFAVPMPGRAKDSSSLDRFPAQAASTDASAVTINP